MNSDARGVLIESMFLYSVTILAMREYSTNIVTGEYIFLMAFFNEVIATSYIPNLYYIVINIFKLKKSIEDILLGSKPDNLCKRSQCLRSAK